VARLQHLRKLVEQLVVGLNVFGAPHRRPPQQGVHFVPIGSDVLSLSRVRWPAALAIGTNSSLPVTDTSIHRDAQYFRQLAIGFKVLHGTVDRARFFVVLDPSLEYGSDGHRRLGADIPEILSLEEAPANRDEDLSVVRDLPPVSGRRAGLFCYFTHDSSFRF